MIRRWLLVAALLTACKDDPDACGQDYEPCVIGGNQCKPGLLCTPIDGCNVCAIPPDAPARDAGPPADAP